MDGSLPIVLPWQYLGLGSRHLILEHFPLHPWIHRFLPYSVCDSCFCALCRCKCKKLVPFAAFFRKIWAFYCGQIELLYSRSSASESKIIVCKKSHIDQAPVLVRGEKKVINDDPEWKTNKFISELLFASIRIKTNLRWWTFGRMTQFHDVDAKLVLKRRERKATLTWNIASYSLETYSTSRNLFTFWTIIEAWR